MLTQEQGTYLKKWTGRLPIALIYPNSYQVGMSSLGLQLVYRLLNDYEHFVCERVFLPGPGHPPRSIESGRTLDNFPLLFFSVSFEHDYFNVPGLLLAGGIAPLADQRPDRIAAGSPLVVGGGVATFMNPEPLAPFFDVFALGEAEALVPALIAVLGRHPEHRSAVLDELNRNNPGFYAPRFYEPIYDRRQRLSGLVAERGMPVRISKQYLAQTGEAGHSELLTEQTEFSELYLTELGRGCSRGCRFCTAAFIYRPPRLWDTAAVLDSLQQRPATCKRVGLLGMEMTAADTLQAVAGYLQEVGCALSFSSLRADRISEDLVALLAASKLKSVAIAPDGASERLRKVINKGLAETDLLHAAEMLVTAGLHRLKLYLMIGLPSETEADLHEFIALLDAISDRIVPIGRRRGRLSELVVSVNCFVPKPWTPFQYHPFGSSNELAEEATITGREAVALLRDKVAIIKKAIGGRANIRTTVDHPEQALFQAVLSRGDRRLAPVLLSMAASGISWKRAMKNAGLGAELFATRQYGPDSFLPWQIVDHGIDASYLWGEYRRAFMAKPTSPCDTVRCKRCGVCHD